MSTNMRAALVAVLGLGAATSAMALPIHATQPVTPPALSGVAPMPAPVPMPGALELPDVPVTNPGSSAGQPNQAPILVPQAPSAVPEPQGGAIIAAGLLLMGAVARRRRNS